ncbi:hypothetical protein [Leuconostoc mesenteroides]
MDISRVILMGHSAGGHLALWSTALSYPDYQDFFILRTITFLLLQ